MASTPAVVAHGREEDGRHEEHEADRSSLDENDDGHDEGQTALKARPRDDVTGGTRESCQPAGPAARRAFTIGGVTEETTRLEDTLVRGYKTLALETPHRPRDVLLRALDIGFALLFLILSLPIAALIALLVLITSGRPVLYRGERVGLGGHVFTMYKFRTLRLGAENRLGTHLGEELVAATKSEFTPLGPWLKATQLDEIPQFINVLRGDMSLVGPRPIRPVFFGELVHELPSYWQRLVVRPGLTGLAQVRRGYETSMAEKLAHDLEWIADRSVRLYLRTVVATGWRVLKQSLAGIFRRRA
jgi:lipopolysaccharide/colanic/teichoic acid biosynthesis glycosyltransferase